MLIHLGVRQHGDYKFLPSMFPKLKVIYAHAGVPYGHNVCELAGEMKNVIIDLSSPAYMDIKTARRAIAKAGANKCLFGSDGPYLNTSGDRYDYGPITRIVKALDLSKDDRARIERQNFIDNLQQKYSIVVQVMLSDFILHATTWKQQAHRVLLAGNQAVSNSIYFTKTKRDPAKWLKPAKILWNPQRNRQRTPWCDKQFQGLAKSAEASRGPGKPTSQYLATGRAWGPRLSRWIRCLQRPGFFRLKRRPKNQTGTGQPASSR
eukprot:TRINITY_DN73390_c0_g1_i1.p1 TRINITY_DN73390_c0_g1~~TRINITY_DN73390_c0_g1_i1.p1  ORF type:complete len:263 (-),score=-7.26 TRINITY_DN73390_c0_g1_i1:105-893(-)